MKKIKKGSRKGVTFSANDIKDGKCPVCRRKRFKSKFDVHSRCGWCKAMPIVTCRYYSCKHEYPATFPHCPDCGEPRGIIRNEFTPPPEILRYLRINGRFPPASLYLTKNERRMSADPSRLLR